MTQDLITRLHSKVLAVPSQEISNQRLVSAAEIAAAERELGFSLPQTLAAAYQHVGDGGFGPGYGILGITSDGQKSDEGDTAVELYQVFHGVDPEDPNWNWPTGRLPLCHWGCAIYSCVDCTKPLHPVLFFDPNGHEESSSWTSAFIPHRDGLDEFLTAWLDDADLWAEVYGEVD